MTNEQASIIADAIVRVFESPNVSDSNGEAANIVDAIASLSRAVNRIANAIVPADASPGRDERGGVIGCVVEAMMSMTQAIDGVADGMDRIADSIAKEGQ